MVLLRAREQNIQPIAGGWRVARRLRTTEEEEDTKRERERGGGREGERERSEGERGVENESLNWLFFGICGLLFFLIVWIPWRTSQPEKLRVLVAENLRC